MSSGLFDFIEKIEPKYRKEQVFLSLFNSNYQSFNQATNIPKDLKDNLNKFGKPNLKKLYFLENKSTDTFRVILETPDKHSLESVLMKRISKKIKNTSESRYTVCLSTQIGCPMKCVFCATGNMNFVRNLTAEEIVAQLLFWQDFLFKKNEKIDNIVLMGQGEPLLNYEAVKKAINLFIKYNNFGPRKITLSTVGVKNGMQKMIEDDNFPPIRFALSLHSALSESRKKLIPTHSEDFFDFLISWSKKYHKKWPSRTHFIAIEYLLIEGVNDSDEHLKSLMKLLSKLGRVKINLIPLNTTIGNFCPTKIDKIKNWQKILMDNGYTVIIRLSQGQDINAACGQLKNSYDQNKKNITK